MASPTEILTAGGLANADLIVQAATATGIPLAIAAAMIQKESGGKNVYGHDGSVETGPGVFSTKYGPVVIGGTTYAQGSNIPVTQGNFAEFLRRVTAGEKSNGVGPAQLTYAGYFKQAPDYPFWDALANIRFGLTILADYLDDDFSDSSISSAGAHYNGGTNPNGTALAYGADLLAQTKIWRARLAGASELGGSMPKVFLSPSDQDNNPVHGGGNEQQYAQVRCRVAADVLRNSGIDVKVSEAGIGDDSGGYAASVREGEAWGPDLYIADHSNAVGGAVKRRGIHMYTWPGDLDGRRLAQLIIDEVRPIFGGPDYPTAILNGSHLYEVNGPSATVVFMELGFHDHPEDAAIIRTRSVEIGAAVGRAIAKYYGKATQPSEEEDIMSTESTALLGTIADRLLVVSDALTVGKEGVKFDGDVIARLRSIESKLDALAGDTTEPERAEPEPETPAETAPVTGATAIREALATARAALSIIEANL